MEVKLLVDRCPSPLFRVVRMCCRKVGLLERIFRFLGSENQLLNGYATSKVSGGLRKGNGKDFKGFIVL